jgi:hypothetical protein
MELSNPLLDWNYTQIIFQVVQGILNGTACFKNVNNHWKTNIFSYLETSSGKISNLYLNVVHFFQHPC